MTAVKPLFLISAPKSHTLFPPTSLEALFVWANNFAIISPVLQDKATEIVIAFLDKSMSSH